MRVISGKAKGTKLINLEGLETRPTTDKVKEAVFSIINNEIFDSIVLDLFSGSGAIGIEAASRGAKKVILVENNVKCREIINKNVEKSRLTDIIDIVIREVHSSLKYFRENTQFDIIFMDPPYGKGLVEPVLNDIVKLDILSKNGIVIVEHSKDDEIPKSIGILNIEKEKKYGKTCISIYRRNSDDDSCLSREF